MKIRKCAKERRYVLRQKEAKIMKVRRGSGVIRNKGAKKVIVKERWWWGGGQVLIRIVF